MSGEAEASRILAENVARARAALAPLLEAQSEHGLLLRGFEADAKEPSVFFDLQVDDHRLRMQLAEPDPARRTFLRTPSFDVLYRRDRTGSEESPEVRRVLDLVRRSLEARDRGQFRFARPPRLPKLLALRTGADSPAHEWSRELFDSRVEQAFPADFRGWAVGILRQGCDQFCVFCPSADRDKVRADWAGTTPQEQFDDLSHQYRRAYRLGARKAGIGGNDALRFPLAVELVTAVFELGYERALMHTTGLPLADDGLAERLAPFRELELLVPIYGSTAEEHEAVTCLPGSFERLCRGLDRVVRQGSPRLKLQTIALDSSIDRIPALADFVRERFGATLSVSPLRANRLGERRHLEDAGRLGRVRGLAERRPDLPMAEFPRCVTSREQRERTRAESRPGDATYVNMWALGLTREDSPEIAKDLLVVYPERCSGCAERDLCPGVLNHYVERFGSDDLTPLLPA
jgi:uncharacterized Fe-S cluster-containing radical SAM superfamily protein